MPVLGLFSKVSGKADPGPIADGAWRLFHDAGFEPIAQQISAQLPKWKANTVVQIGANDGQLGDPKSALMTRWKALFVEPIPSVFNKLVTNYGNSRRFMFEQAAVSDESDESGNFSLFFLSPEAKGHARPWRDWRWYWIT